MSKKLLHHVHEDSTMMAGGLIRRLGGEKVKQYVTSTSKPVLEVDWSVLSGAGLGLVFKALLADLVGAPPPPELEAERLQTSKQRWKHASVEDTYFHRNLATSLTKGSLIRGIIYDMPSLIQSRKRIEGVEVGAQLNSELTGKTTDFKARDWMSLVDADIRKEIKKPKPELAEESVQAADVIEKLGLKGVVPGLADRVQGGKSKANRRQNLEALIGKSDGIRAKYADRIRTKKILADARHEQRELGITDNPAVRSSGSNRGWRIVRGSPVLMRYLEKRGLSQGLIARGKQVDLDSFFEQIGNFQFQHVSRDLLQDDSSGEAKQELSAEVLRDICRTWGLPPKQILLVLGEGRNSQELILKAGDLGFFVCKVKGAQFDEETQVLFAPSHQLNLPSYADSSHVSLDTQRAVRSVKAELQLKQGLRNWFQRLASGTLDVDNPVQVVASEGVHFTVADMIELKWIIEDLNGVSYRRSTMIRGFEEMVGRK